MSKDGGVSFVPTVDDQVSSALKELARRVKDIDPVLDEIGASQVTEVQDRFEHERGPDGKPWKGLAEITLAHRRAKGATSPKILSDTRNLYDSVTHRVASGVSVTVGTNRAYARRQQLGDEDQNVAGAIPARAFLGLSDAGRKEILAIVADHLGGDS